MLTMEERRRVTNRFSDMKGFNSASEAADPEVVADALNFCFQRLGEDIAEGA